MKFAYGADIGWLTKFEEEGIVFQNDIGEQKDVLDILKEYGIDSLRFRVFVDPPKSGIWEKEISCMLGYADKESVLREAIRAKEKGFRIMIDFHYSDYFADPAVQIMPKAWENHSFEELVKDVYDHTSEVLSLLKEHNISPEWVQVGNEINSGIMLPAASTQNDFDKLTILLNSGYDAVKHISPDTLVITHIAEGQDIEIGEWFFHNFLEVNAGKTDIIGLSYYPYWQRCDYKDNINNLCKNMDNLVNKYGKPVMICEIGGDEKEPENSYEYVKASIRALKDIPNEKGVGVFWWEPEGNSAILPDKYPLGATEMINQKTVRFTKAMKGFKEYQNP